MSKTFRRDPSSFSSSRLQWARTARTAGRTGGGEFRCRHCKTMVGPLPSGGRHRNHCPLCLHSRHVDGRTPGDRASDCGGTMAPIGAFARSKGEQVIVHQCLACGFERHNRLAADDNVYVVMRLPILEPRVAVTHTDRADVARAG